MPRYRINYLGRTRESPFTSTQSVTSLDYASWTAVPGTKIYETEFQDEVDAKSPTAALEEFFAQHADRREDVMIRGSDGQSHPIEGLADYDPGTVYLWIEDNWFMEYQGIEELALGKTVCPMCNGDGEVEESLIDTYEEMRARAGNS